MQTCLVTGVAGFIGSHLAERLLREGFQVIGLDSFTDNYPITFKKANLIGLQKNKSFRFIEADLLQTDLRSLLTRVDFVFHEAALPGVRQSWGTTFNHYVRNNILATQNLLEAAIAIPLKALIVASSSSVYGNTSIHPFSESAPTQPVSPYAVSKLAAEQLCSTYFHNYGIPIIILRYFTVIGPRQRPDMAVHKFITSLLTQNQIVVFGDGEQSKDFVVVDDVVESNILAMSSNYMGETFNIGSGESTTVNQVIHLLSEMLGKETKVCFGDKAKGDVTYSAANIEKARHCLGFTSRWTITDGLRAQHDYMRFTLTH